MISNSWTSAEVSWKNRDPSWEAMIEPIIPYEQTDRLLDVAAGCDASPRQMRGGWLRRSSPLWLPEDLRLRDHQAQAIQHSFRSGTEGRTQRRGHLRDRIREDGVFPSASVALHSPRVCRVAGAKRGPLVVDSPDPQWKPGASSRDSTVCCSGNDFYPTKTVSGRGPNDPAASCRFKYSSGSARTPDMVRPLHRQHPRFVFKAKGKGPKAIELAAELKAAAGGVPAFA